MRKLTPKQQRFVDEYLIDLNATQAAIRAGCEFPISGEDYYVYALVDPVVGDVFYIGKGRGSRAKHHWREWQRGRVTNDEKHERISLIAAFGATPQILFLESGLTEVHALDTEAAFIGAIGLERLTNILPYGVVSSTRAWGGRAWPSRLLTAAQEERYARYAWQTLSRIAPLEAYSPPAWLSREKFEDLYWLVVTHLSEFVLKITGKKTEELLAAAQNAGLALSDEVRQGYLEKPVTGQARAGRCLLAVYPTLSGAI